MVAEIIGNESRFLDSEYLISWSIAEMITSFDGQ